MYGRNNTSSKGYKFLFIIPGRGLQRCCAGAGLLPKKDTVLYTSREHGGRDASFRGYTLFSSILGRGLGRLVLMEIIIQIVFHYRKTTIRETVVVPIISEK